MPVELPRIQFGIDWQDPMFAAVGHITLFQRHIFCAIQNTGLGSFEHRKAIINAMWPEDVYSMHAWSERRLRGMCSTNWATWAGPGGSGKTFDAAAQALEYWLEAPHRTAVIVCSTTIKMLRKRIWNAIAHLHTNLPKAIELRDAQGNVIERNSMSDKGELIDSDTLIRWRKGDTKNGIFGIAVDEGPVEEAIANLVGIHTHRVWLILDEMQGVKQAIMGATRNMAKNPVFRFLGMGNPESKLDPHGVACEPIAGWSSISEADTEEWDTRGGPVPGNGLCQFFDGRKSPAILDAQWAKRHPWMINAEQIAAHLKDVRGNENDPSYWSQSIGWWPPMGVDSTVLDEAILTKFHCTEKAVWTNGFFKWSSLDPAFEGADDKILTFGKCGQVSDEKSTRWTIEITEQLEVPIDAKSSEPIHYQIVRFCKAQCIARGILPNDFGLDSSGEGGGLKAIFDQEWGIVHGIEFGGKPSDMPIDQTGKTAAEAYDKRSSELNFSVREFALGDGLRGLPNEAAKQFCARKTFFRAGKWCVEPKTAPSGAVKGFKQRMGFSPDEADSIAIGVEICRRKGAVAFIGGAVTQSADAWNAMARRMSEEYSEENYAEYA